MRRAPSGVSGREIPGWSLRNASAPGTGEKKKKKRNGREAAVTHCWCAAASDLCALCSRGDDWLNLRQIRT